MLIVINRMSRLKKCCIINYLFVSMLQPVRAGSLPLSPQACFLDQLNARLYFLGEGELRSHDLATQQVTTVPLAASTATPHHYSPTLLLISGQAIANVNKSIVSANSEEVLVRSSIEIVDGSQWQWHAPISLQKVKLGICKIDDNEEQKYELFEFNSSTPRNVTFAVQGNQLLVWVNGHPLTKNPFKNIDYDSSKNKWYPCAKLQEKGNTIIFSPFTTFNPTTASRLNPFAKIELAEPIDEAAIDTTGIATPKITKLIQISKDNLLVQWQNKAVRIFQRNQKTGKFDFDAFSVQENNTVLNAFSPQEYAQLQNWRGEQKLFPNSAISLSGLHSWLKYLISCLDYSNSDRVDIYTLLLTKLALIRPYLPPHLRIPNSIRAIQLDQQSFQSVQQYFATPISTTPTLVAATTIRSSLQYAVEGAILDVSQNYIATRSESTIILYNVRNAVSEVFREVVDKKLLFSKHSAAQAYEEEDIRNLKNEGSFLYKILSSCLQKEKKSDEPHTVNENDVKELVRDYGIDEAAAREALEETGHVEQALVWIFTDKKQEKWKRGESFKDIESQGVESVHLVQLSHVFARVILQVGSRVFVLGALPNEIRNWFHKGEKEYVDLLSLKHEDEVASLDWHAWYAGTRHPKLHILDQIQTPTIPQLLYKEGNEIFYLAKESELYYKRGIDFNSDLLYEPHQCISLSAAEPLEFFAKESLQKTTHGQLISHELIEAQPFLPDTFWCDGKQIYSNITHNLVRSGLLRIELEAPLLADPSQLKTEAIPFTVESGPPGCSSNYSITSLLHPKSSFLANYPQQVVLKHLHNKLIQLSSFTLHRSSHRKNINYIIEGEIFLIDEWGASSPKQHFEFAEGENQKQVELNVQGYWKYVVLAPKFTAVKKLPFEYGFISLKGKQISAELYHNHYLNTLAKHLTERLGGPLTAISAAKVAGRRISVLTKLEDKTASLIDVAHKAREVFIDAQVEEVASKDQLAEREEIAFLAPSEIIKSLIPPSNKIEGVLRRIARSPLFSFATFSKIQVFKFIDLALYYTGSLLPFEHHFATLFGKLWQNQWGKEYLLQLAQSLDSSPTLPFPYLQLLIKELDSNQHISTVKSLLAVLPRVRSPRYDHLNKRYAHLIYETQFHSDYYINLIEESPSRSQSLFGQALIEAQLIAVKEDHSRRIIIRLPGTHYISNLALRLQRSEQPSKANYRVYAISQTGKTRIGNGKIQEHQWAQLSKDNIKLDSEDKDSNIIGLEVPPVVAQYLQIELAFTETGIISHQSEVAKVPQVDIIPQLYGYPIDADSKIDQVQSLFAFNPEETFFLSVNSVGTHQLQKYSVSKGKQTECFYFKPQRDDENAIKTKIEEKIQKDDLDPIPNLQRKLVKSIKRFSNKLCLDYIYSTLLLSLNELESKGVRLDEEICGQLFELVVRSSQGPIKACAFRALSKSIPLLVKSLQYVEDQLPSLGKLSFSYEELINRIDLTNAELCANLTKLILRVVDYEPRWAELLIRMAPKTQSHEEIIKYFLSNEGWLENSIILDYIADFTDAFFEGTFLPLLSYPQLCKLVTKRNSPNRLELLLEVIVQQASVDKQVDLDVVSLIFRQDEVRWEQLEKVVTCCPQAIDTVVHQFLQAENSEALALQHSVLLNTAATPKYSEQFALFLNQVYSRNKSAFKEVVLNVISKCSLLHYDCLETIGSFIFSSCNYGGIEGVRLLTEDDLSNLIVAVETFKVLDKLPEGAEIPNEDGFIEWYLTNNDFEELNRNPANKSAGYHLLRQLAEHVRGLLKSTSSSRVLNKYAELVKHLRNSRRTTLFQRHLRFGQMHHGATQLLTHSLAPGALAEVLVGPSPTLTTVLNQLKASIMREGAKRPKWGGAKQIDITQKFQLKIAEAKDLQTGKAGTKSTIARVPVSQRVLRLQSGEMQWPSKFLIGFTLNDQTDCKNSILPTKAEFYAGSGSTLFKAGQLRVIEDQHYLSFGVRLFGINLNVVPALACNSVRTLEVRLSEPALSSASEVLENTQRSKKGANYGISFINISGYDGLPADQPDYSQLYVTLLGFLGQPKYLLDLRQVVKSELFDQKLELIIQVLNDLLPNQLIENLLLALNREGENILEHVLRSKGANPHLVSRLLLGKLNKINISKLLAYTLQNLSKDYVEIVTMSIRLASYSAIDKNPSKIPLDFANIEKLVEKYASTVGENKQLYFQLLAALLTVPNFYHYEISKLIQLVWNDPKKSELYAILAAVLPYYQQEIEVFASSNYTITILQELLRVMQENRKEDTVIRNPFSHVMLLNTLIANDSSRSLLLSSRAPIKIVQLLKSEKSLLLKYNLDTMRQFISFFQGTCIGSECQDEFSEILISLMTSLNNFDASHHQFFIQSFFFPLINAFKGVPLFFVWKSNQQYIWQPTEVLKRTPIRSSSAIINYQDRLYAPVESITEASAKGQLIVTLKQNGHILFKFSSNQVFDLQTNKPVPFTYSEGKITIEVNAESHLVLPNEKYTVLEENEWEHQLLTNSTLINLNNPWILEEKYRGVLPIRESTNEKCYFLPLEITLAEVLKTINISGFRVHASDLPNIKVTNILNGSEVPHDFTLRQALQLQKLPFLKLEVQAGQLFKSTTIETLVQQTPQNAAFVPQETIFKAFEKKKGLEKLIGVLTGCVKNWTNAEQSKIWEQYLKQLESYSCFPVFSSLYMTRQANVNLLFDLLFGLPDKQDSKKWSQREKESVKELYGIIKDVFAVEGQQAQVVRSYALTSGFYATMLNRLHLITKEPKREKVEEAKEEDQVAPTSLEKKQSEEEFKNKLTKRKGVGYGNDSSTNQKWDVTGQQEARKQQSEQILGLLRILEKFLDYKDFQLPDEILDQTYESALLPIIENSLRGGSLLEISKYAELIQGELSFIQVIAHCKKLIPTLMPIPKIYEPRQPESLHSLLKTLANTSKIFLSCLTGSASEKVSEEIAKKITATFDLVDSAVSEYETAHNDEEEDRKILQLPLSKKYPLLLKDLRFDYIDMKDSTGKITKHHYASYYQPGHKSPVDKTVRLAQELADVSHALPIDHTNAIFVRCDKERVDYMQALIMGSNGTPYGHGAYLFDIYFEDNYPNGPPKVNLTTTGNAQIRFNPNLYSCGKVCLSLLGTWRGSAMENWDSKVSTLLQVLVSIQSIIMSEDIYFNEPGFEHEQGTLEGEKKNQAYANIVRYGNVKFAMIDNIKNPPKGFETIIRRHFFLKREEILEECQKWLKLAEKREASYNGLVSDHNYNWCNTFKKSKNEYKTMLEKAVKELQMQLNKLPPPTHEDLKKETSPVKPKRKPTTKQEQQQEEVLEEIDVSYGGARENVELDINDERVKDRWSRYIGAMGVEAVSKQSKASILLLGLGPLGVEIAKNIVLSGCKELSVWDDQETKWQDLNGQFFLGEADVAKPRLESTIYKLQQLNHYVKVNKYQYDPANLASLSKYQVVIATSITHDQQLKIDQFCRTSSIHFISADCYGPYGQIFNDFGESFQILDKNGEETVEVILEDISNDEKGLVRVSKGLRHPFQDGQTIRLSGVKGMKHRENESQSINGTLHKVEVIDQFSFRIGSTIDFTPYEGDGTARNIKTPIELKFKSLAEAVPLQNIDSNLEYYDFTKGGNLRLLHHTLIALSQFRTKHSRLPSSWNKEDALLLVEQVKALKAELNDEEAKYVKLFSYTCSGNFGPICAFYGGFVSQEAFKAITGKYTPIHQYFLTDFSEVVEQPPEDQQAWEKFIQERKSSNDRREGIKRVIGEQLLAKLENAKIFMVGSGAIGCELLKNFAMLEIGAGEKGSIVVTDPDHIETSNLNRQFLFREKHLRKPKSATAAAAVTQMNPRLKGHIKARLDKVCQATKDIFSNEFFEGLSIVANALDNVEARRYVDSRCVENKIALLESGTLSSKGHVQVIIPYLTETYGSKQDPNDANGEVPHCTLKMFPEETLHCVEWARDLFGKDFTLAPKALAKLLQSEKTFTPTPSDIQMLKDCLKMLSERPANFEEAAGNAAKVFYQLFRNDILQLLYTYPLDAKTKDGKPFWRLPKRPPTPIEEINPEDPLHTTFITSYAVLQSKVHGIPFPKDFRDPLKRKEIALIAKGFKVEPFVPSDRIAKQMTEEVNNDGKQPENPKEEVIQEGEIELFEKFKQALSELRDGGDVPESKAEEFEKDQDQNGHIDVIYSMANLRARNYKLEEMEWINVKLKAGRIMPALSTTTSCIAALQTIELIKYIKGCKVDAMRNAFINLAVPIVQLGEPGEVQKIKVHENLKTNVWQRWSVKLPRSSTLRDLMACIEESYGVIVKGLEQVQGGQVYSDIVLGLQSKKQQRERVLGKTLSQLLEQSEESKYVDLTLVMAVKDELIKHAPTLRVTFQQ